jgi:hypothetical protein
VEEAVKASNENDSVNEKVNVMKVNDDVTTGIEVTDELCSDTDYVQIAEQVSEVVVEVRPQPSQTRRWSRQKPNCYGCRQDKKQPCENRGILKPSWAFVETNIKATGFKQTKTMRNCLALKYFAILKAYYTFA